MAESETDGLRRRIAELEALNDSLRRNSAAAILARDDARIVDEITGNDGGTDPFAAAVRATRMPMVISNPRLPDNPIVFVNDAFCRLTGHTRDEIVGRNCRFLQGPETDPETVARIRAAVDRREPVRIDILNYRKSGETFWNRLLMAPVRNGVGELAYFFASQVDVTLERERLEGLETHNAALMAEVSDRLHIQQESTARLNFAAEAGRLGIWEQDLESGDLTSSSITRENFGRDRSDPLTTADLEAAIHPEDRAVRAAARRHSIAEGADYDVEFRIVTPAGATRWLHMRAQVMRDIDGRALRMAGVCLDVTARKVEDIRRLAMVELSDRIRDLDDADDLASAAAGILGRTLSVSRAGYGTVDLAAETVTISRDWNAPGVRSIAGLLHFRHYGSYIDDLKEGRLAAVVDARTDARTADRAEELVAIDARSFLNLPVTESSGLVALLFVNNAEVRHWTPDEIGFMRDLAERTRVAIERRRAEASLRALTLSLEAEVDARTRERNRLWATTNDLMGTAGLDGTLKEVNPAWGRSLGWDRATLLSRPFLDIIDPADHAETLRVMARLRAGESVTGFLDRIRTREGEYRMLMWNAVPAGEDFFIVGRDVTEQHQAEEALRQSQKMEAVGQLTGGLAHDFNNLLTGISGSLELLGARVRQGRIDDIERYVVAAQGASKRAAALTHRLLAFSRRQTLDPRPTDVNRLIHDMADLIRRTVGPAITLEVVGSVGLWTALVDPNQLENALLNLAINARDAMPDDGRLTVETGNRWMDERAARERDLPPGQYLSLCVSDTGTGMPPHVVARAFDPFFTTKPLGQGTGLGLSMIYGFARQSGGQVRIYSEVGQGTMVCVYLPRHYGERGEPGSGGDRSGEAPRAVDGETVLVVDDEPTVRMLVADVLADLGYAAIEAEDGPAGLKVLEGRARVDLLITDVGLPGGMNGRQVADAARVLRPGLKVLFITGYAENAVVGNGHLDPGMEVLTKPFAIDDLADRIRGLID
ncbi:PAS domain S-box protein [Lichenibacterium ramalinae]|uniref:histidine kinase n=1 Tax=Lichenibacterium ramalinae TaxID=2316527 RepID=A0A4Q2RI51_9HYPH|nr:PAS domain S-box protein [Lichenibacterium ramalinae]RYB07696.1 PAS domain S-box protein [Lichenibacterium ramalinae]